jgi:hypothetical protein
MSDEALALKVMIAGRRVPGQHLTILALATHPKPKITIQQLAAFPGRNTPPAKAFDIGLVIYG